MNRLAILAVLISMILQPFTSFARTSSIFYKRPMTSQEVYQYAQPERLLEMIEQLESELSRLQTELDMGVRIQEKDGVAYQIKNRGGEFLQFLGGRILAPTSAFLGAVAGWQRFYQHENAIAAVTARHAGKTLIAAVTSLIASAGFYYIGGRGDEIVKISPSERQRVQKSIEQLQDQIKSMKEVLAQKHPLVNSQS